MDTHTDSEWDAFLSLQPLIQVCHGSEDIQPRAYCSLGVIFMGLRIAEIDKQTIAQKLGNVSVKPLDAFRTVRLIRPYRVAVLFGVELRGEFRGINQITEHHGELAAFRVRRRCSRTGFNQRGGLFLSSRLWCWLSRRSGEFLSAH